MSKIEEMAMDAYPVNKMAGYGCAYDANALQRDGYIKGANAVLSEIENTYNKGGAIAVIWLVRELKGKE